MHVLLRILRLLLVVMRIRRRRDLAHAGILLRILCLLLLRITELLLVASVVRKRLKRTPIRKHVWELF